MIENIVIPKEEQILALANGLTSVYALIKRYTGQPIMSDFRRFITISKNDLINFLTIHPEYSYKHIKTDDEAERMHDLPVLLSQNDQWIVCWMDHGRKTEINIYNNLPEAAANYLMAYW